jgi:hypothetical protein
MEKLEFTTADGTKCKGYLFTWESLSFGLTRDDKINNNWIVFELQTGCRVTNNRLSTRKVAVDEVTKLLSRKGIKDVKKRLKQIFIKQGNAKDKGRIKTAHCTLPDNWLTTLCGRARNQYCLPLEYFRYAKNPCKKCQLLADKKKTS